MTTDMIQMLDAMENSIRRQIQAKAARRAAKAEQDEKEFQEKLARAAASKTELDTMASTVKGNEAAMQRDQLIAFMMAGF